MLFGVYEAPVAITKLTLEESRCAFPGNTMKKIVITRKGIRIATSYKNPHLGVVLNYALLSENYSRV